MIDDSQLSQIAFAPHFDATDYFLAISGGLAFFVGFGVLIYGLVGALSAFGVGGRSTGEPLFLAGICFFYGGTSLSVRNRVLKLIRTPTHFVVRYSYGVVWHRRVHCPKEAKISTHVKDQSVTDYDAEQSTPFFELTLRRRTGLSLAPTKFYVCVNPRQMSWLDGGLRDYFASGSPPTA